MKIRLSRLKPETHFLDYNHKHTQDTGMDETLRGDGPFTVLAPSDHVFRTLPEAELTHLQDNLELQRDLVQQHILQGGFINEYKRH